MRQATANFPISLVEGILILLPCQWQSLGYHLVANVQAHHTLAARKYPTSPLQ